MQTGLSQRIKDVLALDPSKGAIEFKEQWFTWGQLQTAMNEVDQLLTNAGLEEGEAVAIVLRNRPVHVASLIQTLVSRRCTVPVNPFQSASKISSDLKELKVPVIIADTEDWQKPELVECAESLGAVCIEISCANGNLNINLLGDREKPSKGPYYEASPETAVLMLTSGTTGPAKRIKLSYNSFEKSVLSAVVHYEKKGGVLELKSGVSLLSGPLVHIGGLYFVFDSLVSGRSFCLLEKFNVAEWASAVKRHGIKMAAIPPTAIRMVMDANVPVEDLQSLIALRAGSAPLENAMQEEFENKYGIAILDVYGATEFAGAIAGWTLKDHQQYVKEKRSSVGRAQPGVELRVVDPESGEQLPNNTVGILEVRSPQAGKPDWVRTTDLSEIDDDGFLFIRGRSDNAIIRGGFKVLPAEIEQLILTHPAVKAAGVLGIPDRRLGAVPVAGVELNPDADITGEELVAFVRENTVAYKTPTEIRVFDELPRTDSMKVSLHELKKIFTGEED